MRRCVILGAGGFVGSHMVKRLKRDGHWVRGVDLHLPHFSPSPADDYQIADLRDPVEVYKALSTNMDTVYQFATAMGGAGYIFTGHHDAEVMHTAAQINLNVVKAATMLGAGRVFFPSSACIYPQQNQATPDQPDCREDTAYPANPDSEYGWEKLFAERLYLAHARNAKLPVTIARFHSIVGPEGTWTGGKEKVFAALCRKIAEAPDGGTIAIWGDGEQTRTFLLVDDCLEGIERLIAAGATGPVNLGSAELISINQLAWKIMAFAGKSLGIRHEIGPLGVRGRQSDHTLLRMLTHGWAPTATIDDAVAATYPWVAQQVQEARR